MPLQSSYLFFNVEFVFRTQKDVDFDQLLSSKLVFDRPTDDHSQWPLQFHLHARQPLAFRRLLLHRQ